MFNNLTCLLVRSVTETLKCLNVLILFLAILGLNYSGKESFRLIGVSGVVLYVLTTATIKFINKNNKDKNIKFFISIVLDFIISFAIIKNVPWDYKPYCVLYFLGIILFASLHYGNNIEDVNGFIKKYAYSTLFFLTFVLLMQGQEYFQVTKIYFPLYMIMSILYIMQVNILEEYNDVSANLINEDRNIRRFSIVSIFITVMSVCIFTTDFFKKIYYFVSHIIETLVYIIYQPVSWLMIWFYQKFLINATEQHKKFIESRASDENKKKLLEESLKQELLKKEAIYENKVAVIIIKVFIIAMFIGLVCFLIYIIYKEVMKIKIKHIQLDTLDGEERSFVFKKDKSGKTKGKRNIGDLKDLHVIRRIYIEVIKILKSKGIEYKSAYTPNEYGSVIQNTDFKSKNVDELVNIYNNLRYGNKTISKEDVNKAYKIKDNL